MGTGIKICKLHACCSSLASYKWRGHKLWYPAPTYSDLEPCTQHILPNMYTLPWQRGERKEGDLPTNYWHEKGGTNLVIAVIETAKPLIAPSLSNVTELLISRIVEAKAAETKTMKRNFMIHSDIHSNQDLGGRRVNKGVCMQSVNSSGTYRPNGTR